LVTGSQYLNMKRTPEHNKKISESMTGRKLTASHRAALSASHQKYRKIDLLEYMLYLSNQGKEEEVDEENIDSCS